MLPCRMGKLNIGVDVGFISSPGYFLTEVTRYLLPFQIGIPKRGCRCGKWMYLKLSFHITNDLAGVANMVSSNSGWAPTPRHLRAED